MFSLSSVSPCPVRFNMNALDQLAEIEAVKAVYPEALVLEPHEANLLELLQSTSSDSSALQSVAEASPPISFGLRFGVEFDFAIPVLLRVVYNTHYPASHEGLQLRVAVNASRAVQEALQRIVGSVLSENSSGEAILLVAAALLEDGPSIVNQHVQQQKTSTGERVEGLITQTQFVLARLLIWSHHIKSPQKKKDITHWARELGLGGFMKPGFPGLIIAEGEADSIDEFWRRIRSLAWQAIQVRYLEKLEDRPCSSQAELDGVRRLPKEFVELPETAMGELGQSMEQAGLKAMFNTGLKLGSAD